MNAALKECFGEDVPLALVGRWQLHVRMPVTAAGPLGRACVFFVELSHAIRRFPDSNEGGESCEELDYATRPRGLDVVHD